MRAVLDHVGIAVADVDKALAFYRDALGLEVDAPEEVRSQRVRAHFMPVGQSALELLAAARLLYESTQASSPFPQNVFWPLRRMHRGRIARTEQREPSTHRARSSEFRFRRDRDIRCRTELSY